MLIDWPTVVAQLINFVILVVALKFLLYDRLVDAMEERRRTIAAQQATADERAQEAERELARLRAERSELEEQRDQILARTRDEAEAKQRQRLRDLRADVELQEAEWRRMLHRHQQRLLTDLTASVGRQAVAIARRLLADMTERSFEEALLAGLVQQVNKISEQDRAALARAAADEAALIAVRSAFELSSNARKTVEGLVGELVGDPAPRIGWERERELIFGVVIQIGARTVEWSAAGYLDDVERDLAQRLRAEVGSLDRVEERS